jgi:prepilin-type processing-associated H-X9-DG protein
MKPKRQPRRCSGRAFSLIELIVLLVAVVLLVLVVVPALTRAKQKSQQIDCMNNLKQIGWAFRLWSGDNADRFVMQYSTNEGGTLEVANEVWRSFLVMSNELHTPLLLACPSDSSHPTRSWSALANSNISYFVGLDADEIMPELPLSGDSHLTSGQSITNRSLIVQSNDVVRWTAQRHEGKGNFGFADGNVRLLGNPELKEAFANALQVQWRERTNATLRLAMPE